MLQIGIYATARPAAISTRAATWARVARWAASTWCVLNGGHYKVRHFERHRMALRCVACGHTTPGWAVGKGRHTNPEV